MEKSKSMNIFVAKLQDEKFLWLLKSECVSQLNFEDKFTNFSELLKVINNNFERFHKNLTILNFPNSKIVEIPDNFTLNCESVFWGPQIIIINGSIYCKQPEEKIYISINTSSSQNTLAFRWFLENWNDQLQLLISDNFKSIQFDIIKHQMYFFNSIKSSNLLWMRFLKIFLFDFKGLKKVLIKNLIKESLKVSNSKCFLELIGRDERSAFQEIRDNLTIELLQDIQDEELSLLMHATFYNNLQVVQILLHHQFNDVNYSVKNSTAASIAVGNKNYKILIELLKHDATLEKFDLDLESDFESLIDCSIIRVLQFDFEKLHQAIKNDDNKDIALRILEKYPTMRHFYDTNGDSAISTALKNGKKEFYEFLIAKRVFLGPNEDIQTIIQSSYRCDASDITKLNRKLFKLPCTPQLMKLMTKTKIGYDVPDSKKLECNQIIFKALNKLSNIEEINYLYDLITTSSEVKLIFEFNRDTVDQIDPSTGKGVMGLTYLNGWIYIGAKGLKNVNENSEEYLTALGTIAHEICHLAMQLLYENVAKPFKKNDFMQMRKFQTILDSLKIKFDENEISEQIISRIFSCYEKSSWIAELIVRVPEFCAFYINDIEELERIKIKYKSLFEFYKNLMPHMKKNIEMRKIAKKVNIINEIIGFESEIKASTDNIISKSSFNILDAKPDILVTNSPKITMKILIEQKRTNFFIFLKFETLKVEKIVTLIQEALECSIKPFLIIFCDQFLSQNELIELFNKFNTKMILIIENDFTGKSKFKKIELFYKWKDFDLKKFNFTNIKVNFQDVELKFLNMFDINAKVELSYLNFLPINSLFTEEPFTVGKKPIEFQSFYYERNFIDVEGNQKDLEDIEDNKVVLLSDEPGMGKSTTFKKITLKLKAKNILKWILYTDLKLYFSTHKKFKNEKDWSVAKIITVIADLMKFTNFETEFFLHKLKSKQVILLFDGVDEISPDFKEFIVNFMTKVHQLAGIQIWIASRPHCVQEIKNILNISSFELSPIDQKKFIAEFFEFHKINQDERDKILNFINYMQEEWNEEYKNPLLVMIVLDIYNQLKDDDNLYTLYEIFIRKKLKLIIQGEGKGEIREDDLISSVGEIKMTEFHQKMAINSLIKRLGILEEKFENLEVMKVDKNDLEVDSIFGFGILYGDSFEKCFFSHQTFAEFFTGNYFILNLLKKFSCNDNEKVLRVELFWLVMTNESNKQIQRFIEFYLKKNSEILQKNHQDLSKVLNEIFDKFCQHFCDFKNEKLESFVFNLIFGHLKDLGFTQTYKFFKKLLKIKKEISFEKSIDGIWNQALNLFGNDEGKKILTKMFSGEYNIKFDIPKFNKRFLSLNENQLKIFVEKVQITFTREEVLTFFVKDFEDFIKSKCEILSQTDESFEHILSFLVEIKNDFYPLVESISNYQQNSLKGIKIVCKYLEKINQNGESLELDLLLCFLDNFKGDDFQSIWEIIEKYNLIENFKVLEKFVEILIQKFEFLNFYWISEENYDKNLILLIKINLKNF